MQNHHTGIVLYDYEITISPRGGVGAESKKIVRARAQYGHESDVTFIDYLKELAINQGLFVAQHHVMSYIKRL